MFTLLSFFSSVECSNCRPQGLSTFASLPQGIVLGLFVDPIYTGKSQGNICAGAL